MGSGQSVRTSHFSQVPPPGDQEEHRISISNKMIALGSRMGSGQSARTSHFSQVPSPGDQEEYRISITNKMVERLVEDATLAGGAAPAEPVKPKPASDYKDKMYTEKIKCLDETHSERSKITVEDISSLVRRIDLRSSSMTSGDAVCPEFQEKVIECYTDSEEVGDVVRCWGTIDEFSRCVQAVGAERLLERTRADAAETARRTRRVAHARGHALRDLTAP